MKNICKTFYKMLHIKFYLEFIRNFVPIGNQSWQSARTSSKSSGHRKRNWTSPRTHKGTVAGITEVFCSLDEFLEVFSSVYLCLFSWVTLKSLFSISGKIRYRLKDTAITPQFFYHFISHFSNDIKHVRLHVNVC